MSIRTVHYTVNPHEILPTTVQFGGLQGEHNATTVYFTLSDEFYAQLLAKIRENKQILYRFDAFDSTGAVLHSESLPLTFNMVTFKVGENLTRNGGKAIVYLVLSMLDENNQTEVELYSFPARLRFESTPTSSGEVDASRESLSGLEQSAKASAKTAEEQALLAQSAAKISEEASSKAQTAQRHTAEARFVLEKNTQFVFDGGNAEGTFGTELAVDGYLSDSSENPVQNKVINAALNEKFDKQNLAEFLEDPSVKSALFFIAYPVGSVYYSNVRTYTPISVAPEEYEIGKYYVLRDDGVYLPSIDAYNANTTYYWEVPTNPQEFYGGEWDLCFRESNHVYGWKRFS